MKMPSAALATCLALALAACASGPDYEAYSSQLPSLDPAEGRIFVYRTEKFGLANQPPVELDGEEVGEAVPEGFFYIDVPPGEHTITCETEVTRSAVVVVEPGETYYVRLNAKLGVIGNRIEPELVRAATGRKEIKETSYIGGE